MILLLTITLVSAQITEIHYNPEGNDNNKEFVEVLASNLTNWTVESGTNDTLELLQETGSNYSLIVEEGFNYTDLACNIYSVGATIGDGLQNTEDELVLYNANGTVVDTAAYAEETDGSSYQLYNQSWIFARPTPCLSATPPEIPEKEQNTTNCTFKLNVDNRLYAPGETILFSHDTNRDEFEITYRIKDIWGNHIREHTTENRNEKRFTPPDEETLAAYVINSTLDTCDISEQEIIVVGKEPEEQSSITIAHSSTVLAGDTMDLNIAVFKGDTNKRTITIESALFDTTKLSVYTNGLHNITIPVNVDVHTKKGTHTILAKGLDLEKRSEITVERPPPPQRAIPTRIKSFYTRSTKPKDNMTVYSRLQGNGTFTIEVHANNFTMRENITLKGNQTWKQTVPVLPGQNTLLLTLLNGNKVVDQRGFIFIAPIKTKETRQEVFTEVQQTPPKREEKQQNATPTVYTQAAPEEQLPWLSVAAVCAGLVIVRKVYKRTQESPSKDVQQQKRAEQSRYKGKNGRRLVEVPYRIRACGQAKGTRGKNHQGLSRQYQERQQGSGA